MSKFLKITSVSGGIGTIAGITGIAVLASQTPGETVLTVSPIITTETPTPTTTETTTIKTVGATTNQNNFGLDLNKEAIENFFDRKAFKKHKKEFLDYIKDTREKTKLQGEIKQLKENKTNLDSSKKALQKKVDELKEQIKKKEAELAKR